MSTPTEAHLDLALQISEAIARSGNVAAAKLIADSEARAIAKQVEALAIVTLRWDKLEKEQDQLRAERADADADEIIALAHWNKELKRAMKAEAELATERARLDWLMAGGVCLVQHSGRIHVSRLHAPVSRADIDAAMKEGAK